MNIHSLNDYAQNDNNAGRSNNNNANNQFFMAQMNPENSGGDSFFEQLFPKNNLQIQNSIFYNNMYFNLHIFHTINSILFIL